MRQKNKEREDFTSVDYWRSRFNQLRKQLKDKPVARVMVKTDDYYNTLDGSNEIKNLLKGVSSLSKTKRGVETLEKYLNAEKKPQPVPRHLRKMHLPK